MAEKITLELTRNELTTLGMAMGFYTEYWMNTKEKEFNKGEDTQITQRIINQGFDLWEKIQANY